MMKRQVKGGFSTMDLKKVFQKQGGIQLIKQYFYNGTLLTAICEFILLGKSRTSLEILRLSTQVKVKNRLQKKYKKQVDYFNKHYDKDLQHKSSNKVWVCWFQGIENSPTVVQKCYQSLKENLTESEIVLLTSENMFDYVSFPDYILNLWKKGIITNTHMTDLLRLELLINYGGMWIDATVFCTEKQSNIPKYFFESDLFMFQCLKPGRDGHTHMGSSWLLSARTNNKILMGVRYLSYEYWKTHSRMDDYFLFHVFMTLMLESNASEWRKIIPRDNATPHILLLRLFERYDEDVWNAIKEQTPFHKLSYKFEDRKDIVHNTFYDAILGE